MPELDLRHQPPLPESQRPAMPSRFSQTFLRHAANCMHSGYLYLMFKGGPGSHEMDRGTAAHLIAERMGRHALEYGEPIVPHEIVREIVNEVVAEVGVAPGEIDYLHVLAYHLSEALTFDPETIVALERKVVMQIGGYTIVGKIDIAWVKDLTAGVRDYKTSMNLPDNAAWGPGQTDDGKKRIRRFLFQALLYALLLKYGRPVYRCEACGGTGRIGFQDADPCLTCDGEGEIVEDTPLAPRAESFDVGEWYPAYMYEDEKGVNQLVERSTVIALEELENHRRWLEALITRVARAFDTGEWPAVPGSHCNECPAQRLCPIPPVLRDKAFDPATGEVIVVDSNESARAALALRDRLMAEAGELWEQAKNWADQGNTIVVGDQVYEFKLTTSRSVRRVRGSADWDGLADAVKRAAETGEDFDLDYWIKKNESTRFQKRALRPEEKTPDYPEEVETNGSTGRSDESEARGRERGATQGAGGPAGPERFGDEAPF